GPHCDLVPAGGPAPAVGGGDVPSDALPRRLRERSAPLTPPLNAIVTLTADKALARAHAADEARARGEWWGPLHGVPCTSKDTFATAGVRTTAGSPSLSSHVPTEDAVVVARLRAAGAVLLRKT